MDDNNNGVNYGPDPVNSGATSYGTDYSNPNPNQQPPVYSNAGGVPEKSGMCTAAMICGILSFFVNCCGIMSIVAIVLGVIGKGKTTNPDDQRHAKVGIICGIVSFVLSIVAIILYAIISGMNSAYYY